MSALLISSRYGHVESIRQLFKYDVDFADVDAEEKTCLMLAAEENQVDAIEVGDRWEARGNKIKKFKL